MLDIFIHNRRYLSSGILRRLSLKVILYKNNMHTVLKSFATVLRN